MSNERFTCKNYRPNTKRDQLPGACLASSGQVLADLYNEAGKFVRTAVVADCGGSKAAERYAARMNAALLKEVEPTPVLAPATWLSRFGK